MHPSALGCLFVFYFTLADLAFVDSCAVAHSGDGEWCRRCTECARSIRGGPRGGWPIRVGCFPQGCEEFQKKVDVASPILRLYFVSFRPSEVLDSFKSCSLIPCFLKWCRDSAGGGTNNGIAIRCAVRSFWGNMRWAATVAWMVLFFISSMNLERWTW